VVHVIVGLILSAVKPVIAIYQFARSLALGAATERLTARARAEAETSQSALAFRVIALALSDLTRLERWAARELTKQGRLMIRGECVEIGVSMISPAFLEAMSWRGRF
jgi:hypothetical protein